MGHTTRREVLTAGVLLAPGLLLADSDWLYALPRAAAPPLSETETQQPWPRQPIARSVFQFNQGWRFHREDPGTATIPALAGGPLGDVDEAAWETVHLPHTVRLEPRNASGGRNFQGVCWYSKRFTPDAAWKGRVVTLTFQGAMQVADVWLNGQYLGTNHCGYLPFAFDISSQLRRDAENVVTLRLNNADDPQVPPGKPQSQLDFVYFGGLYRSAELTVHGPLHVTDPILRDQPGGGGVFVTVPAADASHAVVAVRTEIGNGGVNKDRCAVRQELHAPDGTLVASKVSAVTVGAGGFETVLQQLEVVRPMLWHPEHPHLYQLHTSVLQDGQVVDDVYTRVGIKRIAFDREKGLSINGEPFFSIGANRHQDHPYVGYALSASAHWKDVKKLRDAGFTSYRSHYPQDPAFMDACDELGVLAIVSNPGWQFMGDEVFRRRAYKNAQVMVRRDRNRASILLWEAQMNETDNAPVCAELYRIVHEEYPGDQAYAAGDRVRRPVAGFTAWDVQYSDNRGERPEWDREWGDLVDNWTDQQGPNRVERDWGENSLLSQVNIHYRMLDRIFMGQERPVAEGHARVSGAGLWAGIDAFRGYHHQPFLGGPLDLFRVPKFDYFMFQSQRPPAVNADLPAVETGPMVFIASYATWQSPLTVNVFSNCEQVRLIQNGKEVATQPPEPGHALPHAWFPFTVARFSQGRSMLFGTNHAGPETEVGELRAEGLIGGKVVASHVQLAPGVPTQVRLAADLCGRDLVADGGDWVRVYATVADARGGAYPYGGDDITFTVQGEGSLITDARIANNPVAAEAGIATALVRSSLRPGTVTVRATAFGLAPAELRLTSAASPLRHWPA